MAGSDEEKATRKGGKQKRKDVRRKKEGKDKKRRRGLSDYQVNPRAAVIPNQQLFESICRSGDSSSDDSGSSNESSDEAIMTDVAAVFSLKNKDTMRPPGSQTLQDLSSKQLGYCLSNILRELTSTRVLELGGELEAWTMFLHLSTPLMFWNGLATGMRTQAC